jgi:hypothetical protein
MQGENVTAYAKLDRNDTDSNENTLAPDYPYRLCVVFTDAPHLRCTCKSLHLVCCRRAGSAHISISPDSASHTISPLALYPHQLYFY